MSLPIPPRVPLPVVLVNRTAQICAARLAAGALTFEEALTQQASEALRHLDGEGITATTLSEGRRLCQTLAAIDAVPVGVRIWS